MFVQIPSKRNGRFYHQGWEGKVSYKRYTADEIKLIREYYTERKSLDELAERIGRSKHAIELKAHMMRRKGKRVPRIYRGRGKNAVATAEKPKRRTRAAKVETSTAYLPAATPQRGLIRRFLAWLW